MDGFNFHGVNMLTVLGAGLWLIFYLFQKKGSRRSRYVELPGWLVWLFGRPLGNAHVDIVPASLQFTGLLLASLDPLYYIFEVPHAAQVVVWEGGLVLGMFCAAAASAWSDIENQREFDRSIADSFAFLTSEQMFKLVRKKDPVTFESNAYTLRVRLYKWKGIIVTIQPKQCGKASIELGVSEILHCLQGREPELDDIRLTKTSITQLLRRNSQLLQEHCSFVLTGDLEVWKRIEECDAKYFRKGTKTRR